LERGGGNGGWIVFGRRRGWGTAWTVYTVSESAVFVTIVDGWMVGCGRKVSGCVIVQKEGADVSPGSKIM
jgi:hypothetical protein